MQDRKQKGRPKKEKEQHKGIKIGNKKKKEEKKIRTLLML